MDKQEQDYWRTKWKESTNVVTVQEMLIQGQAVQIVELKAKLEEASKFVNHVSEIDQLKKALASSEYKLKRAENRLKRFEKQPA